MSPMISVVEGDLTKQLWSYSHGKLSTLGRFWPENVKLTKVLVSLERVPESDATELVKQARVEQIYEAVGGRFGLIGMAIGAAIGSKAKREKEIVCFRAVLKDGRRFTAVSFADVFEDIQAVTGVRASE